MSQKVNLKLLNVIAAFFIAYAWGYTPLSSVGDEFFCDYTPTGYLLVWVMVIAILSTLYGLIRGSKNYLAINLIFNVAIVGFLLLTNVNDSWPFYFKGSDYC